MTSSSTVSLAVTGEPPFWDGLWLLGVDVVWLLGVDVVWLLLDDDDDAWSSLDGWCVEEEEDGEDEEFVGWVDGGEDNVVSWILLGAGPDLNYQIYKISNVWNTDYND